MTTFSERMTAARKDKKLTQDQVAQALDVSRQLVSHWENGRVEPTQEQREAFASCWISPWTRRNRPRCTSVFWPLRR